MAYVFRGPRSFTRQDVLELHIPGSPPAATALVAAMIDAGARRAQAGEFTARAFFSGRLDLSAAEAVADIIDSSQQAQLRQAVQALGGRIAALCRQAAEELTDILACAEASIDLDQEQIEMETPSRQAQRLAALAGRMRGLADSAADMPEQSHMPRVVLCGLPNAGKSSLLNALSGRQRAIVSDVAGTTRDVLGQTIVLRDSLVLLQDAAGLGLANDDLSRAADRAARGAVSAADLLLLVVNAASPPPDGVLDRLRSEVAQLNNAAPLLILANKIDLAGKRGQTPRPDDGLGVSPHSSVCPRFSVSAVTGQGLEQLRRAICDRLHLQVNRDGQALGLHQRQKRHFIQAAEAATRAAAIFHASAHVADQAELAAVELRAALAELGAISGQVATEDVLGRIFQRFCVGK